MARGRVRVGLSPAPLEGGLTLLDLELEVHGAPADFDPGGGTGQFRSLPCSLLRLEVAADSAERLPGSASLGELLTATLAPVGWPIPDASGLRHVLRGDGGGHRSIWQRPGAEALSLLEEAADARARGEPDAALRLALAGQAALAAGLPVEREAAIRTALDLGLRRDEARDAWAALVAIAREHADPVAERHALTGLVPVAPTGERPSLLLRLSDLALSAEDVAAARTHAEEARTLAPRDLVATEACLAMARRVGDGPAVIDLLDRLAALDPAGSGARLLERARLLAASGRLAEADAGFREALARLPPERTLADEQAALRRSAPPPIGRLRWSEPVETFAGRAPEAAAAARAYRDAAGIAREQGDLPAALRAARRAQERAGDLFFAGEMLAELLHTGGSVQEALTLHEALLAPGQAALDPGAEADRLAALAELAEETGRVSLTVSSLDRLLELRPHDAELVEWRFRVDPDRSRALERLTADAGQLRSRLRRARLLTRAAAAARTEAGDPARERELLRRAQEAASGLPAAEREVAAARLAAARAAVAEDSSGAASEELCAELLASASALGAAGDAAGATAAREEAVEVAARSGRPERAVPALEALEAEAAGSGDLPRAATLARRAGRALLDAGDGLAAEQALRRALGHDPRHAGAWGDLESIALSRGDAGAPILAEVLSARAASAEGAARAESLVTLARVLRGQLADPDGALQALRSALEASPGDPSAESELDRLLAATGRFADLGRALLDRTAREADPDARARLRLRAAEVLADAEDEATRSMAVPALLAVLAEPPPGRGAILEAAGRLSALGRGDAAAPYLLALCQSDPLDGAAAKALGTALRASPPARAEAFLTIAAAAPAGPVRAGHLREAAAAFAESGDEARLRETTRATFEAWPADDVAFRASLAAASGDVDATDAILLLRAAQVPAEAPACHRARADLLLAAGRPGPATRAYEACLAIDPADANALAGLAEAHAAERPPGKGPNIADLLRPLLASARALADSGQLGAAYARLKLAREIDPDHLELTLGLSRVAEKLGYLDESVSLGEAYADGVALTDRAAAAARYRALADTARERLADSDHAAALQQKAAALDPEDPATAEMLSSLRAGQRNPPLDLLAAHLAALRERPADVRAARSVAILSGELADGDPAAGERAARIEQGAVADALARFVQRLGPDPRPLDLAFGIAAEVRSRVAAPGADGPTARLLSILAPYLEPLFPVDLARHGATAADRVAPASAPALQGAIASAHRAVPGRPLALFVARRPGLHAGLENTRPPSLVLSAEVVSLPPGALAFLAARSVALSGACWPLVGKFAPRDVLILCELASRFAGGAPPPLGLPPDRAGAFLDALERSVPPSMRDFLDGLGPSSAGELASLDPAAFASALERTANRVALLHVGDLHGALTVLARLHRPGVAPAADPEAALGRADLDDLARFALSDPYLDLRGMLLGWP
jgi:hypothetical protein